VCNRWKHSLIFKTIEEVKVYVSIKWEGSSYARHEVRELQPDDGTKSALDEVLQ